MHKTIILDLDSTLNDMHLQVYKLFRDNYGYNLSDFSIPKDFPFDITEIHNLIEKHNLLNLTKPLTGAGDLLETIKTLGFEVGIITSRKCYKNTPESVTLDWLKKYKLEPDWIEITDTEKYLIFQTRKLECFLFLDDDPKQLTAAFNAKVAEYYATLIYPWTKHLPHDVLQFNDLFAVSDFIKHAKKIG